MSDLIAIKFDSDEEAMLALRSLRELEAQGQIAFDDTAVLARDVEGKLWVKNEFDSGIEAAATVGGLLGLLLGPLGLAVGAVSGAAIGQSLNRGIDDDFVEQVQEAIQPDTSALFLMVREADARALVSALSPYEGRIIHTTLSPEAADVLNMAMRGEELELTSQDGGPTKGTDPTEPGVRASDV